MDSLEAIQLKRTSSPRLWGQCDNPAYAVVPIPQSRERNPAWLFSPPHTIGAEPLTTSSTSWEVV